MKDTLLSKSVTVNKYVELESKKDRKGIADFVQERFTERYITPLRGDRRLKHGFCTMAINCLTIEALESFWNGWADTRSKGIKPFQSFFERCKKQESELGLFLEKAEDFYKDVRCGILHQAETTKGYHLLRKGPLFEEATKTINATRFHNKLEEALKSYCQTLRESDWDDEVWKHLRKKMKAVIKNCNPSSG